MISTGSVVMAAALGSAAVVIPLSLLGYTMRSYGAELDSHLLVPAIGPIVIAVLILEYVEYNRRVDEAYSAQLIPANLLLLSDVKLSRNTAGRGARISGHVVNRSPNELTGMRLELNLYGGNERLSSGAADAQLDVAPGQQSNFAAAEPDLSTPDGTDLPCQRTEQFPSATGNTPSVFACYYRVAGTRGEEVAF